MRIEEKAYKEKLETDYVQIRERFEANKKKKEFTPFEIAKTNGYKSNWQEIDIPVPHTLDLKVWDDLDVRNIVPYIDWSPFFWTWEIRALFPRFLSIKNGGLRLLNYIMTPWLF